MSRFQGTWELDSSDHFDEYMEAVGVDMATRLATKFLKPTLKYEIDGDRWTEKIHSTFKNHDNTFQLDREFEETTADGRKVMSVYKLEGDRKLIKYEKGSKVESIISRELVDDDTLVTMAEAPNVVAKRVYKRKHT